MKKKQEIESLTVAPRASFKLLKEWDKGKYKEFITDRQEGLLTQMEALGLNLADYKKDPTELTDDELNGLYDAYFNVEVSKEGWTEEKIAEAKEYCYNDALMKTFGFIPEVADVVEEKVEEAVVIPLKSDAEIEEKTKEAKVEPEKKDKKVKPTGEKKMKLIAIFKKKYTSLSDAAKQVGCHESSAYDLVAGYTKLPEGLKIECDDSGKPKKYKIVKA